MKNLVIVFAFFCLLLSAGCVSRIGNKAEARDISIIRVHTDFGNVIYTDNRQLGVIRYFTDNDADGSIDLVTVTNGSQAVPTQYIIGDPTNPPSDLLAQRGKILITLDGDSPEAWALQNAYIEVRAAHKETSREDLPENAPNADVAPARYDVSFSKAFAQLNNIFSKETNPAKKVLLEQELKSLFKTLRRAEKEEAYEILQIDLEEVEHYEAQLGSSTNRSALDRLTPAARERVEGEFEKEMQKLGLRGDAFMPGS